jgi:hypothetical protein
LRRYLAVVHGQARNAVYDSVLVPDRGDGLRGSMRPHPPTPSPIAPPASGRGAPPPKRREIRGEGVPPLPVGGGATGEGARG